MRASGAQAGRSEGGAGGADFGNEISNGVTINVEVKRMPTLTLSDEQVIDLVRQLPVERKQNILTALEQETKLFVPTQIFAWVAQWQPQQRDELFHYILKLQWPEWAELSRYGATQARLVAAERGYDWDAMTEEERERLIDDIVHEDHVCPA